MREYTPREYQELILEELGRIYALARSQFGAISNLLASNQSVMLELQKTLLVLARGLEERSEKRYQEEISDLETRIKGYEKLLEEKKQQSQQPSGKTSQDIERIAINAYQEQQTLQLAEQQKQSVARKIKWQDLAIGAAISYIVVQIAIALIKLLGQ